MEGPFTSDAALLAAIREKLEARAALLEACEDALRELAWADEQLGEHDLGSVCNTIEVVRDAIAKARP